MSGKKAFVVMIALMFLAVLVLLPSLPAFTAKSGEVEGESCNGNYEALMVRLEELEREITELRSAAETAAGGQSERELGRIADSLAAIATSFNNASERWLRDISGDMSQVADELYNIRRALEQLK